MNANQKGSCIAYFITGNFARWQDSNNRLEAYDRGAYFILLNAPMLHETDEIDEAATFKEVEEICKNNLWILDPDFEVPQPK